MGRSKNANFRASKVQVFPLGPNGPEKWGCRMRIRDLFSKIRDLFSKKRDYETKKTAGAAEPPSLAPMIIFFRKMHYLFALIF